MLRLKNIKMENNLIEADYYPENQKEKFGHVVFDLTAEKEQIVLAEGYGRSYPWMAITGLRGLVKELDNHEISELPKEYPVAWI